MPPKMITSVDEDGFQSRHRFDLYETIRKEEKKCFREANEIWKKVQRCRELPPGEVQDLISKAEAKTKEGNALKKANDLYLFQNKNKSIKNDVTIDLHYQHVQESLNLVKEYLEFDKHFQSLHELTIVTGKGGGDHGDAILRPLVEDLLKKKNKNYSEDGPGAFVVKLRDW